MRARVFLAAGLAVAGITAAGQAGAQLEAAAGRPVVGDWRLVQVGGKVTCKLSLTGSPGVGGWEAHAPLACRGAFPPLRELSSWTYDTQGALALTDSQGRKIISFAPAGTAAYETKAPDGKTWRMEAVGLTRVLSGRERMTGDFRLSGAAGATCDMNLRADIFGRAGWVTLGQCAAPWAAKGISIWTLKGPRLTLMDRARKPVVVLKSGDPGVFTTEDPKADPITLARR